MFKKSLMVAAFSLLAYMNAFSNEVSDADNGISINWDFCKGKGDTLDSLSNSKYNGKFFGQPKWVKQGNGYALDFNGSNSYVDLGTIENNDIKNQITVEVWIYPRANFYGDRGVIGNIIRVDNKYTGGFLLAEWTLGSKAGQISDHEWYVIVSNQKGEAISVTDGQKIEPGKWQHVAFTYDGYNLKLFLNGKSIAEAGKSDMLEMPAAAPANMIMGKLPFNNLCFNGMIADAVIYNKALSEQNIREKYLALADKFNGRK
ncbi:MAG: LamG domain-containing protein [Victivallaceae bacterium]